MTYVKERRADSIEVTEDWFFPVYTQESVASSADTQFISKGECGSPIQLPLSIFSFT